MARTYLVDFYRRLPRDLTYRTGSGGVLSLLLLVLLPTLIFLESWNFLTSGVHTVTVLDPQPLHNVDSTFQVALDLSVAHIPCEMVDVQVLDVRGEHNVDAQLRVHKSHSSEDGSHELPVIYPLDEHLAGFAPEGYTFEDDEYGEAQLAPAVGGENAASPPRSERELEEERVEMQRLIDEVPADFHVPTLGEADFDATLKANNFTLVNFSADWCKWCKALEPTWRAFVYHRLPHFPQVRAYTVQCEQSEKLCEDRQRVIGLPTIRMFRGEQTLVPDHQGERTVQSLERYVARTERRVESVESGVSPGSEANDAAERLADGGASAANDGADEHPDDGAGAAAAAAPPPLYIRAKNATGCLVAVSLQANIAPGMIRLSARSERHDSIAKNTDVTHTILGLSFLSHDLDDLFSPYKDMELYYNRAFVSGRHFASHEHHIQLVSTLVQSQRRRGGTSMLYHPTMTNHVYDSAPASPEITFVYDFSPVAALVERRGRRWYEFVTSLCAIVGGIYMLLHTLDALIVSADHAMQGKEGGTQRR